MQLRVMYTGNNLTQKKKITQNIAASSLFAKIFILACSVIALELAKPK